MRRSRREKDEGEDEDVEETDEDDSDGWWLSNISFCRHHAQEVRRER